MNWTNFIQMNNMRDQQLPTKSASLEEWESYNPSNWINSIVKRRAIAKIHKERKWFTIRENETKVDFYKRVGIKYSLNENTDGKTTLMMRSKSAADSEEKIDDTVETMIHNLNRRK
jgi:hypothetical protein